ncbi:MAG TPA: hypothetical protein VL614_27020 [Acetobacteraceae bacterium]|nr:hypothetical protein [Acetobacteraceae bacterium]
MRKILYATFLAMIAPGEAWAAEVLPPTAFIPYPDWIVFCLALGFTAWWSLQAFDRPVLDLGGVPTFPRYMTRSGQFRWAKGLFVVACLLIYVLLVYYHKDLPEFIKAVKPDWAEPLSAVISQKDPSYLVAVVIASACFLSLLHIEARWNFLMLLRDICYSWASIPYLAKRISNLVTDSLTVPDEFARSLPDEKKDWHIGRADFQKNRESMDRSWAELCYLQWWISERRQQDSGTTFFAETSFAWKEVTDDFRTLRLAIVALKQGLAAEDHDSAETMDKIAEHRGKLGRLIACYLIYMNSTREGLHQAASRLGINLAAKACDNPLRYSAIYLVSLVMGVCAGVYLSAVAYDLIVGSPAGSAFLAQDFHDVQMWIYLAFGDYGVPILGILTLRYLYWLNNPVRGYSIMVAYAWVFVISAALSTIGLSIMAELVGSSAATSLSFPALCQREATWSIGPALICVYINHYLDRQIDYTRPDIGRGSGEEKAWRAGYALLFTLLVVATALPLVGTIRAPSDASWELNKLRFVAMGTVFCVSLVLALVAQFALSKARLMPQSDGDRQMTPVRAGEPAGQVPA